MALSTTTTPTDLRDGVAETVSVSGVRPKRLDRSRSATATAPFVQPKVLAALLSAVAGLTLMVSLKHLADGIQRITGAGMVEAWACALIFDVSYCLAEVTLVLLPALGLGSRQRAAAYGVVFTCTGTSIVLNCIAFREHAQTTLDLVLATSWGTTVPLLVLVLGYLATSVLMTARER